MILRLRLIIARAAGDDSLHWWNDRSFTPEGMYMVERLFSTRPRLAAAKIAIETSRARHWDAIAKTPSVVHLFDLGNQIEHVLSKVELDEAWIPKEQIATIDELTTAIGVLVPDGVGNQSGMPSDTGALEVQLGFNIDYSLNPTILEAGALALAYLTATPSKPVFPYLHRKG